MAVVGAFLIGCAVLMVVGCTSRVRSEAPQEEQRHTEATEEELTDRTVAGGTQSEAEECPPMAECAPRNEHQVPKVVSMTVPEASRTLSRSGYACASGPRMATNTRARGVSWRTKEKPGSKAFTGQLIHLTVSKPYPEDPRRF